MSKLLSANSFKVCFPYRRKVLQTGEKQMFCEGAMISDPGRQIIHSFFSCRAQCSVMTKGKPSKHQLCAFVTTMIKLFNVDLV